MLAKVDGSVITFRLTDLILLSNCLPSFTIPARQTVAFEGWIDGIIFLHPKATARIS